MKISNILNFNNNLFVRRNTTSVSTTSPVKASYTGDIVSFRAKSYSADSIANPTNHCAYCGCKVYNEAQIEGLAKEMLKVNGHRLQGDIKSALEKLETAERSYELTIAKQIENKDEIEFYRGFLEQAEDKSWLKGEAIFQQVYSLEYDDAVSLLTKNLRPLLRTIDHVSPQNLGEDNKDDDVNLVEACYCCNHDLKKGMPFAEFYTLYPSIKENMPPDKFKYAHAQLMSSPSSGLLSKVSAHNLLQYIAGLFTQREKTVAQLNGVNFRLSEAIPSIEHRILTSNDEIAEKEKEISDLKAKLATISDDEEYKAMQKRIRLLDQKRQIETELSALREKRSNVSSSKNELEKTNKKGKKAKTNLSEDQIQQKIASYRQTLIDLKEEIAAKEEQQTANLIEIEELDKAFPTSETLQGRKAQFDTIISAHSSLSSEKTKLQALEIAHSQCEIEISELDKQIDSYPQDDFDESKYSDSEKETYREYLSLIEALKYTEQHSNGGGVKAVVNRAAKDRITAQLEELSTVSIVIDAENHTKKKELISKRDRTIEEKSKLENEIASCNNRIAGLLKKIDGCSLERAKEQSQMLANWARRLNEKQSYLKIPQSISKLEAEIDILRSVISSLTQKLESLKSLNLQES